VADPDRPERVARLGGFDSESYASAFTPDGRTLAVGGSDTIVILWDVSDPADPERIGDPITGPPSRVYDLSFGSGGTTLAAAVTDGTDWVWDMADPRDPVRSAVFGPFAGPSFAVAVSAEGALSAGSGADQQIHLWPSDARATIDAVCARIGDTLTADAWSRYVPDEPYDPPC
jgi:WD40 repeat protein